MVHTNELLHDGSRERSGGILQIVLVPIRIMSFPTENAPTLAVWFQLTKWQIHVAISSVFQSFLSAACDGSHTHDKWLPETINNMNSVSWSWVFSSPYSSLFSCAVFPLLCTLRSIFVFTLLCCVGRRSFPRMSSTESRTEDNPYDFRHLLRKTSQRRKLIKQYWTHDSIRQNLAHETQYVVINTHDKWVFDSV